MDEIERNKSRFVLALNENYQSEVTSILKCMGIKDYITVSESVLIELDRHERELTEELLSEIRISVETTATEVINKEKSFLIIKLDGIGDAVLCTPFIRELRKNNKDSRICLICTPTVRDLLQNCPYIDAPYARKYMEKLLEKEKFDMAIVPRYGPDWYGALFLAYFSNAAIRVTFSETTAYDKQQNNINYDMMYTLLSNDNSVCNEAKKNLSLLELMGNTVNDESLELWESEISQKKIKSILPAEYLDDNYIIIIIGLSGSGSQKRWPEENYLQTINALHKNNDRLLFVLCGDEENKSKIKDIKIKEDCNYIIDFTAELSLSESVSLMRYASFYLGNDTGLMHIAAACQCKVVELNSYPYPISDASEYGDVRFTPWGVENIVIRPSIDEAEGYVNPVDRIKYITVDEVVKKTEQFIKSFL